MQYKQAWDMELQEWVIVRPWMRWNSDTWTKGYTEEFWLNLNITGDLYHGTNQSSK
mgnify:CR=1 FL=1